jgi:DNA-binding transcriptional MerR regulator
MAETLYTISQLADAAGVTPRTIRYYTAEGLLPRPDARGQYAVYGEEHLLRLQLIGYLKQAYLPLGEIKARIEHLDIEQVRGLIQEYQQPAAPPMASAADYLAHVRARQLAPAPRRMAEQAEPYTPAETPKLSLSAPADTDASDQPAPAASPAYGFAAPIAGPAAPQPGLPQAPPAMPAQPGLLRRLIPQRRNPDIEKDSSAAAAISEAAPAEDEQRWRRIALAPGVELHVREPLAPKLRQRIGQLIALARGLFENGE